MQAVVYWFAPLTYTLCDALSRPTQHNTRQLQANSCGCQTAATASNSIISQAFLGISSPMLRLSLNWLTQALMHFQLWGFRPPVSAEIGHSWKSQGHIHHSVVVKSHHGNPIPMKFSGFSPSLRWRTYSYENSVDVFPVSYTHLTLPTKRIV